MNGLNPGQMVIKIVNEELVKPDGMRDNRASDFSPGMELTDYYDGRSSGCW